MMIYAGLILLIAMIGSIVLTVDFVYHTYKFNGIYSDTKLKNKYLIYLGAKESKKNINYVKSI